MYESVTKSHYRFILEGGYPWVKVSVERERRLKHTNKSDDLFNCTQTLTLELIPLGGVKNSALDFRKIYPELGRISMEEMYYVGSFFFFFFISAFADRHGRGYVGSYI